MISYRADKLNLLPNYFGDLVKKETGKSAREYLQIKLIDMAEEKIFDSSKMVNEIAWELEFKYPPVYQEHFVTLIYGRNAGNYPECP